MSESSVRNSQALEILKDKLLEIMKDRGIIATYSRSPLSKITNTENTSQFKIVMGSGSIRVNDLIIHNTIQVTLFHNLLTFRDTIREFEFTGDLLKIISNKYYNVDLASLSDKKLLYDFAKEMYFDARATDNRSTRDRSLIRLLKSQGLVISASGVSSSHRKKSSSNTIFLSSDPNELCGRFELLLQEKQAGNNSNIFKEEINAMVDRL